MTVIWEVYVYGACIISQLDTSFDVWYVSTCRVPMSWVDWTQAVMACDVNEPGASYHDYANDSTLSLTLKQFQLSKNVVCQKCGQFHEPYGTHLYDYHQAVDEDLMCQVHISMIAWISPISAFSV